MNSASVLLFKWRMVRKIYWARPTFWLKDGWKAFWIRSFISFSLGFNRSVLVLYLLNLHPSIFDSSLPEFLCLFVFFWLFSFNFEAVLSGFHPAFVLFTPFLTTLMRRTWVSCACCYLSPPAALCLSVCRFTFAPLLVLLFVFANFFTLSLTFLTTFLLKLINQATFFATRGMRWRAPSCQSLTDNTV